VSVAITMIHAWVPFAILPIYVSLEKIDRSLLDAAADLGDNAFARFFRIVLPLCFPGVLSAAILIFVPTTGDYVTPALVGGSDGIMIANIIQLQFTQTGNWPLGAALAVSNIAAVVILALLLMAAARSAVARIR
jgi:spermidine/putrescine transport system permease protein